MSGICGIFSFKNEEPVEEKVLKKMTDALYHRGPDEEGYHFDAGIGLGIRRLAILDLETGHQPIHNEDENIWIVCDGEVYNFLDQRRDLEKKGHHFYTKTDVEIIVHLYEEHGIDCLHFLRGTFSFAIWDKRKRCLFLVRDPIGGKPLYYVLQNSNIIFASEINAILQNPQIERQVNLDAIHLYLTYEYIPSPLTAFQGIEKLTPAHHLFCDRNGGFKIERYWDLRFDKKLNISEEECEKEIYQRLKEATKLRLIGDVPLGAFLSGGYDSSIIVGLMAQEMSTKLKTFTIGFEEKNFSELNYAEIVAKHFGTEHHAFIIGPEVIDTLPDIVRCCGEPFADSSVLPTYHIAKVSQKEITVALNGDGGDEDFGGYPRYQAVRKAEIFSLPFRLIPKKFLHMLADSISVNKPQPSRYFPVNYVRKLLQASIDLPGRINISWQAIFNNKLKYQLYSKEMRKKFAENDAYQYVLETFSKAPAKDILDKVYYTDFMTRVPGDFSVKMDVATMANSLQARSPFLDVKILEFIAQLPPRFKLHKGITKYILKKAFKNILPPEITARRQKQGFSIPIDKWCRWDWKRYLEENLFSPKAIARGYFDKESLKRLFEEHFTGICNHGDRLWTLLVLEVWHRMYIDKEPF